MSKGIWFITSLCIALVTPSALANEVDTLRSELQDLRKAYESRIDALEKRLAEVRKAQNETAGKLEDQAQAKSAAPVRGVSFNPNISVVLDGAYYTDDAGGGGSEVANEAFRASHAGGHGAGEEEAHGHGVFERGFNIREIELGIGAAVDPYFDARSFISISSNGDIELEEAYAHTLSLPAGLQFKLGKFFSEITRHNRMHPHEWDWSDQNLAYQNLFGGEGNLRDIGAQLTWVAPTPFFSQLGLEVFQGEQTAFGAHVTDAARTTAATTIDDALGNPGVDAAALGLAGRQSAPRLFAGFARIGPDLGPKHGLQFGAWGAQTEQHQEIQELEEPDEALVLQGDGYMWGLDAVYKYSSGRSNGHGDVVLQGEYLYQNLDTRITFSADAPASVGQSRELITDGMYLQGWYGFLPGWRVGARYDVLGMTNEVRSPQGTTGIGDSSRLSLAVTWSPTEFSRFRLQSNFSDIQTEDGGTDFDSIFLQYSFTFGSHPAHRF